MKEGYPKWGCEKGREGRSGLTSQHTVHIVLIKNFGYSALVTLPM